MLRDRAAVERPDDRIEPAARSHDGSPEFLVVLTVRKPPSASFQLTQLALPQRILGRDLFWYLEGTGLMRKTRDSRVGRRMAGRETLMGSSPRLLRRRYGVTMLSADRFHHRPAPNWK